MTQATKAQAVRFMLKKHGLLGSPRFKGEKGIMDYIHQVGCVQYDPVDLCGKSHELAFFTRVSGFSREMLDDLLYRQRRLIDYIDKNMCIMSAADWPFLEPVRSWHRERGRSHDEVDRAAPLIRQVLHKQGCATSKELGLEGRADWYWSETTLSRAALETLYLRGELVVHHKLGAIKSYALAEDCLPEALLKAKNPCETPLEQRAWHALRRVGAVGLLWNAPSDAWLGLDDRKADTRNAVFQKLTDDGAILPVAVEGIAKPLYIRTEDEAAFHEAQTPFSGTKHVHFLPPLDCMLWDRKLISALFNFDYKWEIYTPEPQVKYAHYTLPVLYGERFAGRIAPVCDRRRGLMNIKCFWPENGFRVTEAFQRELDAALDKLRAFNGMTQVIWEQKPNSRPRRANPRVKGA